MKNSQVISIPKVVSEWLEIQLEAKGLDFKVYARYIISLLHAHTLKVIFEKGVRVRRLVGFSGPWWYHIHTDVEEIKSWGTIQGLISTEPGSEIETLVEELCKKINEAKEQELLLSYSNSNPESKEITDVVEETCTAKDSETRYYAAFPALKKSSLPSNLNLKKWPTVRGKKGSGTGIKESSKKIKYCIKNYPRKTAMKKEMHNNLERQNVVKSAENNDDESDCDELMNNEVKENNNNADNGTANFTSLELTPCGDVRTSTPTGRSNFSSSESESTKGTFVIIRKNFIERKELFPLTAEEKNQKLAYDVNKYFADLPKEEKEDVSVCAQDLPVSLSFLSDDDVDEEEISAIKDEYNTTKNPRHLLQEQQQIFPRRPTIEKQFFDQFFEFEMPMCLQEQDEEFLKIYNNDILPLNFPTIFTPLVNDVIPLNEIKPLNNDAKMISLMAINHDPQQSAFCVYNNCSDINSSLRSKRCNKLKDFVQQPSTTEYEELLKQQEIRNFVALEGPPIRNKEEDVLKNNGLFKDGTVFTVNNQIKPVNYERSASGTKFLRSGDEEIKYLEYKGNLSIDSLNDSLTTGPIFKDNNDHLDLGSYFKVHFALSNNDKACQTDADCELDEYATATNLKGCVGDERRSKNHSQTSIIIAEIQSSSPPQKNEEIIIIDDEEELIALNIEEKSKDMEEILYGNFEKICKEKTAWLEENDALFAAIKGNNEEEVEVEVEEEEFEENYKRSKFFPTCRLSLEEFYKGTTPVDFIMNNMETNNNNNNNNDDNNYDCSDITSWSTLSKYVFFPSAKADEGIHQNHHSSNNNNNNNNKSRFFDFTGNLEGNCLINLLQDNPAAHSVI